MAIKADVCGSSVVGATPTSRLTTNNASKTSFNRDVGVAPTHKHTMKKNILLCTLGASWAVIPEAYGFLAPQQLPLYQHHPQQPALNKLRGDYHLQAPDEIWVCTTQGEQTQKSLIQLQNWIQLCLQPPVLRIWQAAQTDQLDNQQECLEMRELIVRACLKAHDYANSGQVVLSLAGGRKTMSADMQWAASLFGCQALLHVVGAEYKNMPAALQQATPDLFTRAFDRDCCQAIMPLVTGQNQRSDLLDISMDDAQRQVAQAIWQSLSPDEQTQALQNCQALLDKSDWPWQFSLWDVLAMIKQGFVHSFLSGNDKETLSKQVDAQLYQLISK